MDNFWWQPKHQEGTKVRFSTLQQAQGFCSDHNLVDAWIKQDSVGHYLIYPRLDKIIERHNEIYN